MTLISIIKDSFGTDDKKVLFQLDLSKANDEIVDDMTKAKLLKFKDNDHENQKTEQTK